MQKKKGVYSKFIVLIVIGLNVWFTDRLLDVYSVIGNEPTILITSWFAFTTGELLMLTFIKKSKDKDKLNKNNNKEEKK